MSRLFMIIYTLAASVLAGAAVVAALTMNRFDVASIVTAALAGAVVAIPVAWVVAKRIEEA